MKITDHIQYAEPVRPGSVVYKAVRTDGRVSAIEIHSLQLAPAEMAPFEKRMALLEELQFRYGASVPRVLSWGFTKTRSLPYLEREWIEGPSLAQIQKEKIVLSIEEVSRIAEEVSRVLARCCTLQLIHGHISTDTVLWDEKKQHYVVAGFLKNLKPQVDPVEGNRNEVRSFGALLLKLLTGTKEAKITDGLSAGRHEPAGASAEEMDLPHWLRTCIAKALGNDEQPFENPVDMYSYVLAHYKAPPATNKFYRSKSQTKQVPAKQKIKPQVIYSEKTGRLASATAAKKEKLRFIFDRNIAAGLVIAVLLLGFSLYAQKKENRARKEKALAGMSNNAYTADSAASPAKNAGTVITRPASTGKSKKQKKITTIKKRESPFTDSAAVQDAATGDSQDLVVYRVRSRAYFHNAPDETTKRNAFILHWNNTPLYPLKEENGFVYIVYTNDKGHTSKGWLKKSDLVKQ